MKRHPDPEQTIKDWLVLAGILLFIALVLGFPIADAFLPAIADVG